VTGVTFRSDGSGCVPRIALNFDLADFQARPFMKDAMDFDRIEGAAHADLAVTTRGRSQKELVSALTGKGKVDLPMRTVNYRLEPKIVASTTGQGGDAGALGISVPVIVEGPWDNISYAPDLTGVIGDVVKQPVKLIGEVVKQPVQVIEPIGKIVPGLSSDSENSSSDEPSSSPLPDPVKLLKGLFRR